MVDFVHLHLHTEYSLLDGCCRIGELFDAVKERGMKSVAITDHGVMYGAVNFFKAAQSAGIKAIIGCEVYVAPRSRTDKQKPFDSEYTHLVLLCKNETGYKNLIKMVSLSFTEGFYSKPRIDKELLKEHSEGLIALSACLAGEIPRKLLKGDFEGAKDSALWFDSVFGRDDFYIEIQDHGIMEQKRILPDFLKLSKETGIPLVATNDVHYINKEDAKTQKVLVCLQTGKKLSDENPLEFKTDEFYLKSGEEMQSLFARFPEAIENTVKIAERCNFEFDFGHIKLPLFDIGEKNHYEYLKEKCYEGLYRLYSEHSLKEAKERLDFELSVIDSMGYTDYYLIVQDFVSYAKSKGIPVGPGRGSGAGSIAAYCVGITGIDPLKYQLLFERFLNPERVSMPDFDIDFCYVRRQEVIDYVINKYGSDRVAQIVTFGTLAARNAIRDVGRVMDLPYNLCDKVAKLIPREYHLDLASAVKKVPELKNLYETDMTVNELVNMALKLVGMPRHASTHAAGVVICDRKVSEYVPLSTNDEAVVTQYTMTALDELGLLKMDFLGLRNLTVIREAENSIREHTPEFCVDKIPVNDRETLDMMGKGFTAGVFQYESEGMTNVVRTFKPENIEDLIAILSLYRPGPMESIPTYIHNRFNPQDIHYDTPLLKPILDITYGCIVYQEQVMQICRNLAGYSLGRADVVRRAMSKKKHSVMEAEREVFINGAVKNNISRDVAMKIFDDMAAFSSYAFNKSHAAAYGYVAYQTAYLKCHYPKEYMSALITSVTENLNKVNEYIAECTRLGISILPPSVNESQKNMSVEAQGIRFGLMIIKNLGRNTAKRIIEERKRGGKYTSLYDFVSRNISRELNRRAIENLIKSGALDGMGENRRQMLFGLEGVISAAENKSRFENGGQMDLFSMDEQYEPQSFSLPVMEEMKDKELYALEKEATGMYLTGHPMKEYEAFARYTGAKTVREIITGEGMDGRRITLVCLVSSVQTRQLKSGQMLCSISGEDLTGSVNIVCFSNAYAAFQDLFTVSKVLKITGKVSEREDGNEIILERAEPLPAYASDFKSPKNVVKPKIYLKVATMDSPIMNRVKTLLTEKQGDCSVYFYCEADKKSYSAPEKMWIEPTANTIKEIKDILGEENVKIVEKG
ncbi:MAG: DNA polymerase III subunit alpha [Acutalibacteraceae bacterium]|nr:DNA polymerase III subunit alpha [Acutalibacteraceae bacterium]